MDREHEVGDLVIVEWLNPRRGSKKTLAVVMNKERVLSKIQYDVYYPATSEMSYSWDGWELEKAVK